MSLHVPIDEASACRCSRAFDQLAREYDRRWTNTSVGRIQRSIVWRRIDRLFGPRSRVLDLGCGTGEDCLHLMKSEVEVLGVDASPEMVRIARQRGVRATQLKIEELDRMEGSFDGAISNFGALNCVRDLDPVRRSLVRLIRPGGHIAICVFGRFCGWEFVWYLLHLQWRKAVRRWTGDAKSYSLKIPVRFWTIRQLAQALKPEFTLTDWQGIGICVPPSYVTAVGKHLVHAFGSFDSVASTWPVLRALADHRLAVFRRD
jgi:ubiquinone/menaquinone biosynthesis C-methylase UbiE